MVKFQRLSDSEMEIMEFIWKAVAPVTTPMLLSVFGEKGWKTQTVTTFLRRMVDKGFLKCNNENKLNKYTPITTKQEYQRLEARSVIDSMYGGSMTNFFAALYSGQTVDKKEMEQIKSWFENIAEEK